MCPYNKARSSGLILVLESLLPRQDPVYHRTRNRPELETSWYKEHTPLKEDTEVEEEVEAHEADIEETTYMTQAALNICTLVHMLKKSEFQPLGR